MFHMILALFLLPNGVDTSETFNGTGKQAKPANLSGMRRMLNILLFEVRTVPGRLFNISMLLLIMGAVFTSMLDWPASRVGKGALNASSIGCLLHSP